jgi:hypothetical protein
MRMMIIKGSTMRKTGGFPWPENAPEDNNSNKNKTKKNMNRKG